MKLKNLVLGLVLMFFIVGAASADCTVPIGTNMWAYNPVEDVWIPVHTTMQKRVIILPKQPPADYLKRFNVHPMMNFDDGVLAKDASDHSIHLMIKRSQMVCDNDI